MRYDRGMFGPGRLFLMLFVTVLGGCAPPSAAELALIAQSQQTTAPDLLPQDQLEGLTGGTAEALGAALAAQAAALRSAAAGL